MQHTTKRVRRRQNSANGNTRVTFHRLPIRIHGFFPLAFATSNLFRVPAAPLLARKEEIAGHDVDY